MQLLSPFNQYFKDINNAYIKNMKEINNNGLKTTVQNSIDVLNANSFQSTKDREIKSIQNALYFFNQYDNTINNIKTNIEEFKIEILKKQNASNTNNEDIINTTLNGLNNNIKQLLDTKLGKDKLFDINTELVIGDNIKTPRTFSKEWIEYEGQNISNFLNSFIDGTNTNIEDLDKLFNFVNEKHTEIGIRSYTLKNTESFYNNLKLNKEEDISKLYDLESSLIEFNQLNLNYTALSKIAAKVSSLSLVNYI